MQDSDISLERSAAIRPLIKNGRKQGLKQGLTKGIHEGKMHLLGELPEWAREREQRNRLRIWTAGCLLLRTGRSKRLLCKPV